MKDETEQIKKELLHGLDRLYQSGMLSQESYLRKMSEVSGINVWEMIHYIELPPSRLSDIDEI